MLKEFIRVNDGLSKDELKKYTKYYQKKLTGIQQQLKDSGIPVVILIEGMPLSNKNYLLNELISEIDPRFSRVFVRGKTAGRPFLECYYNALPENGKITFYETGWPTQIVNDLLLHEIGNKEYHAKMDSIKVFERQLKNNGYLLIKLFTMVSKDQQKKHHDNLTEDEGRSWVDTKHLKKKLQSYDKYVEAFDKFMMDNDPKSWHILNGADTQVMKHDAFKIIYESIAKAIKTGKYVGKPYREEFPLLAMPKLNEIDLNQETTPAEYKKELKELQERLYQLQGIAAKKKITTIIGFEGWDAAGKGSAIRRLAYPLDPRLFTVYPIASPEPHEKNNHFLWRFWQRMPANGRISIFDRTWYGRVMVERLEGYCEENDWKRAYNEINEFEKELTDWGAVVIKFWLQVDKDTQLARFTERQNTPEKRWKITDEDWRNREKWDSYEKAINEMIEKTSTTNAPWTIVEANCKLYARLKVLRTVCERLEQAIEEKK